MPSKPTTPIAQAFTPLVGLDNENFVSLRRTKIVCTIGPACSTPEIIGQMMDAGMNCSRLNFSHGDYDTHARMIKIIREEAKKRNIPFTIMQDLQGPKIRIGKVRYTFFIPKLKNKTNIVFFEKKRYSSKMESRSR
jgi:pyruvate kinase